MLDLLKNKNKQTYSEIVPFITDVTGRTEQWVHEQCSFVDGKLPKENWRATQELRDIWVTSKMDEQAEELIYRDDRYILESLVSYMFWSRDYVNRIRRVMPMLHKVTTNGGLWNSINTVVDFGGGIGLSSLHLKQLFDSVGLNVNVVYHNVPSAVKQNDLANRILKNSGVQIVISNDLPAGDCYFMSEVLEHIKSPVKFVNHLLNVHDLKFVMHASSFTLQNQPGHFNEYDSSVSGPEKLVPGRTITNCVNDEFFKRGFVNIRHIYFWNNRPTAFVKPELLVGFNSAEAKARPEFRLPRY